jgi:hypothetical protein
MLPGQTGVTFGTLLGTAVADTVDLVACAVPLTWRRRPDVDVVTVDVACAVEDAFDVDAVVDVACAIVDTVVVDTVDRVCVDANAVVDTLCVLADDAVDMVCVVVMVALVTGTGTNIAVEVVVRRSVVEGGFVDDGLAVAVIAFVEEVCVIVLGSVTEVNAVERDCVGSLPERCPLEVLLAAAASAYSLAGAALVSGVGGQAGREEVTAPATRAKPRAPTWCLFTKRA